MTTDDDPHPMPTAGDPPHEIELKLFVPPASASRLWTHPAIVTHAIGPLRVARIDNRYLDTPDRLLAAHRLGLRLRRIGRRWLQTLKAGGTRGGALSARGEWESEVAGPAFAWARFADTPLAALGSSRVLARRLQPVFTTEFRRQTRLLRLPDGTEVEFAFDVGRIASGRGGARRTLPICEAELEVVRAGSDDAADALLRFAARLVDDVPLIPLGESKAARGYRLADAIARGAAKPSLPAPRGDDGALRHLGASLAACNDALLANVHLLFELGDAASLDDREEAVHQARVAIRRMRSALRTFGPLADGRRAQRLDAALRDAGAVFGAVRDQDVFATTTMKRLDDVAGDDADGRAAVATLRTAAAARRAAAHRTLLDALGQGPFGATALLAMRVCHGLETKAAGPPLAACADDWLASQRARVVKRTRRIAVLDPEERHALRIEVKRLRYALDLLGALYDPARVDAFRDALAELQDRLGRMNDASVAKLVLQTFPADAARDLVFGRYATWLEHHVRKQLPKVAAASVDFELAPSPWSTKAPRTFG